jgi:hypothetical protein
MQFRRTIKILGLASLLLTAALAFNKWGLRQDWEGKLVGKIRAGAYPSWMVEQVNADLEGYRTQGISEAQLDRIIEANGASNKIQLVRYQVHDKQLSVASAVGLEKHPRFLAVTAALKRLHELAPLPDLDFIVSLWDGFVPVQGQCMGPLFAFAKNPETDREAILLPDFESLSNNRKLLKRVAKGTKHFPWEKKEAKVIWRGGTTGGSFNLANYKEFPRTRLVDLSFSHPELVDARFTGLIQMDEATREELLHLGYQGNKLPVWKHFAYKYQILVDGNSCTYSRAIWQLFSNSLVFKQTSPHIQWFYGGLKPYVHYVPVAGDFHDLIEQVLWAKEHDAEAQEIVQRANDFATNNLQYEDILLYVYCVLNEYAKLQT